MSKILLFQLLLTCLASQSCTAQTPDESYTDDVCSYASNEVAINWNAPFVYLAFAMDILRGE
ncbi:MAG: glycoside hydrolase family 9 protein [Phaeodactylibacter sp.]|nr:glycoside hydrolase family 9 protein [Phaeodactylibacter sp.]